MRNNARLKNRVLLQAKYRQCSTIFFGAEKKQTHKLQIQQTYKDTIQHKEKERKIKIRTSLNQATWSPSQLLLLEIVERKFLL